MTSTTPILEIRDFTKVYLVSKATGFGKQDSIAAKNVTLHIAPGEALAVIGESGSGKSTLARSVVGLEVPSSGKIIVAGQDWTKRTGLRTAERRRRGGVVQMVFQDPYQSLDPRQTIGSSIDESLRLHTTLSSQARTQRIDKLLDQVRLPTSMAKSLPKPLSGGQRQRVAIARALAAEPELLVLDEAVSALDVSVQAQVLSVLADVREATGVALMFISHDLGVVNQICERVVVMRRGEIVEEGLIGNVLRHPQAAYTRRLIDSIPRQGWKPRRGRFTEGDSSAVAPVA